MDMGTFTGKTLVFVFICAFIAVFLLLFGTSYALVGITVGTAAMVMLSKDLSVRPFANLGSLMAFMVLMGVGSFIASLDPFLGLAVNFVVVFSIVFLSMQDLRSPMHFPLLLFYATMVTMPITVGEMPDRLLILAVSAVFIVALNVAVNRNRYSGTSHRGVAEICREVARCAGERLAGREPSAEGLERLCTELNLSLYDRLKSNFFTTPRDRRVLDLVVSLMDLGNAVCGGRVSDEGMRGIVEVMETVVSHENGEIGASEVSGRVDRLLSDVPDMGHSAELALRDMCSGLRDLESGVEGEYGDGRIPPLRAMAWSLREEGRRDSARFTFAVRMALIFSLVAFAWDYWRWENAQWMLFTVIAVIVPYLEDSMTKSLMRVSGTLLGAFAFLVVVMASGGSLAVLIATALLVGYAYVLLEDERYDRRIFLYTVLVLVVVYMSSPATTHALDRVMFTLAGVFVAIVANRVVLPYKVSDENMELAARSMAIARERIRNIRDLVDGRADAEEEAGLSIISAGISKKMTANADREADDLAQRFRMRQDSLSMQCSSLYRAVPRMSDRCRGIVKGVMDLGRDAADPEPVDTSGLDAYETECVRRAERAMHTYRSNRRIMAEMVLAGYMKNVPVASIRAEYR